MNLSLLDRTSQLYFYFPDFIFPLLDPPISPSCSFFSVSLGKHKKNMYIYT